MKIFIHTIYYLPEFGSAPILMNELASYLAEKGHNIEVVTTIPRPPHHESYKWRIFQKEFTNGFCIKRFRTNFTIHHIGRLIAWSIYTIWSSLNLINIHKNDVLLLRLPPLQLGIIGFISRLLKRAKVLLSVQDIHPDLSIESGLLRNPKAIHLAQHFEKWIYKNSDEIVVISHGFKKNLEDKGIKAAKVSIIPNWVDTEFLKPYPKKNPISQKFSLENKFVVMYSGTITLSGYLSLMNVIETASLLKEEENIQFVFVGEGLKKPDLVKRAKSLDLGNVVFLPFQPYKDLPFLLSAGDVLLVPLDRVKTLLSVPSKLYNYISVGRPILGLADSQSEVTRIINKANCGLSADPEDPEKIAGNILKLKNSNEQCEIFGENAREYCIENFSKEIVLKKYEDLIRSM